MDLKDVIIKIASALEIPQQFLPGYQDVINKVINFRLANFVPNFSYAEMCAMLTKNLIIKIVVFNLKLALSTEKIQYFTSSRSPSLAKQWKMHHEGCLPEQHSKCVYNLQKYTTFYTQIVCLKIKPKNHNGKNLLQNLLLASPSTTIRNCEKEVFHWELFH